MLCQFRVKNYKSIRDEMIFDMQTAAISEHTDQIIRDIDGQEFLPVASIYGPNGAGKSNVLEALCALVAKVLLPYLNTIGEVRALYQMDTFPTVPFKLSPQGQQAATEYELFFRTHTAEYRYILHLKDEVVIFEQLDRIKFETNRRSAIYVRTGEEIDLKKTLSGLKVSRNLSDKMPLLSYLAYTYAENEIISDAIGWFKDKILFLNYGSPEYEWVTKYVRSSEKDRGILLDMIREMDLDIEDFRVDEEEHGRIYTRHEVDGYVTELKLSEESSGTQKLFGLLSYMVHGLLEGCVLVIDELDAKLHPLLLKHIIETFTNMEINRHGAQLIFTSHDLSTMSSELFRRDEIWFVAKGRQQNTALYSLVEFKNEKGDTVRKDAKFDKQYLEGKYGADPYLRRIIDWGAHHA